MLTVTPAQIVIDANGIPHSTQFDDSYYSSAGGAEECRHVFLNGNQFETRIKNCEQFTIGEIGFGTGINFLTTADAWIQTRVSGSKLHYISIEKYPISEKDLQYIYTKIDGSYSLQKALLAQYPLPVTGAHRLEFLQAGIALTIVFEDALTALRKLNFTADAWFLDGFAPGKNPELWSPDIAANIFRLTKLNGTFASYSSARLVKTSFTAAGFQVRKQTGFSDKREMLTGIRTQKLEARYTLKQKSWLFSNHCKPARKLALVIGGGFAGSAVGAALAARNWQVEIIDRHPTVAAEASGNFNAILMPRLSIDHDLQAQLTLQGFLYSLRFLHRIQTELNKTLWHQCGVIQLPRDQAQWKRMQRIITQENLPKNLLRPVSSQEAHALSDCKVAHDGWYFPTAGWVVPESICTSLLEHYKNISFTGNEEIKSLDKYDGMWHALNKHGALVAEAEVVILANALSLNNLPQTEWCRLKPKRGQITTIPAAKCSTQPLKVICADAYITPIQDGHLMAGASFVANDISTEVRDTEHEENMEKIKRLLPDFSPLPLADVFGRAAIRAVSADRLPVVGPVADKKSFARDFTGAAKGACNRHYSTPEYLTGLYVASGFGSRGMAWIPICAEALACIINNEPIPFNQPIANAIHPNRFLMRQLIKNAQQTE